MSDKICSLINNTFDNGTVHIKNLEQLIRLIVQKLENNVGNKSECSRGEEFTDPISKLFSSKEAMNHKSMCKENEKNPMTDIINLLNLTKRMEALEISVQKLTSIVQTFMKQELNTERKNDKTELVQPRMEKSFDDKLSTIDNDNQYLQSHEELSSLHKFDSENLLIQNESLIDHHSYSFKTNEAALQDNICKDETQMKINEEKFSDLFFACEQNEEKIDETILRLDSLKSKLYCLESRFKDLEKMIIEIDDRFVTTSNVCQILKETKADKSLITEDMMNRFNDILLELTKIEVLEKKYESMSVLYNSFAKFQEDIKKTLSIIKTQVDNKMDRNVLKDFKTRFTQNFENFIQEMRGILSSINQKAFALGTSMKLESNLNCISCKNNVIMKTELDSKTESHIQDLKRISKKSKLKSTLQKRLPEVESFCSENSFNFPLPQFFIVTRDNSIFNADPIECLKNPNYKRSVQKLFSMQLYLSKLVDLALLNPNNIKSENFNILHTLLHIILKKLNLTDLSVGLDNNSAEIVAKLMENMSEEPSISFKEYHIKPDGSKVKKKIFNSIGRKHSLIHIHKNNLQNYSNNFPDIVERILLLESKVSSMLNDHQKSQNIQNDFDVLSNSESKELFQKTNECEELNLIKNQISDLSNSLKLHSNCLKKVKCEDIPKINSIQNQLSDVLRGHESQQFNNLSKMKNTIKILQQQILSVNEQLKGLISNFDIYKNILRDEISLLVNSHLQNSIIPVQKRDDLEKFSRSSTIYSLSAQGSNTKVNKIENKNDKLHSISTTLDEVQQQLSSQSICMHQFIRDLASKTDRCEFEIYSRELNDLIDAVVQLKRDVQSYSSVASCMTSMNCMSTNVNMISTSQNILSSRPLKNVDNKKLKRTISPRCLTPFYKNRYRVYPYYHNL